MHKNNQTSQSKECLNCLAVMQQQLSFMHMFADIPLCQRCLKQFSVMEASIEFYHHPLRILYAYNSFFRSMLFQYKGLYDYALKDAFLCLFKNELSDRYRHYIVIVAPSSQTDNDQRGFAPVEEIAKTFSKQVFTGLYKKEKYKQSELSYDERQRVESKIGIHHGERLKGKKVLIFDDVVTSGSTLLCCLSLVLTYHPQTVELLVLATRNVEGIKKG